MRDIKKDIELSKYRYSLAKQTYNNAKMCFDNGFYRDCINRSYYAVFYAIRAVLALESIDFKRHKDVVAYFNKEFVAQGKFPGEMGRRLARLKMKREESDYSDFFIASADEAQKQIQSVEYILPLIKEYLAGHGVEIA
ncbi:HEPN domain-containing protein [Clostridium sp. Marseille-P3244]|uniref:HEPN domain-containing protein n=1 Tax=Clostridium sp. Marseille-P3244 TaxID=1871020 RepID=UPI00093188B8|nr:HEPN domain-containing protein [Clostridium sp. Marseille-P3244]